MMMMRRSFGAFGLRAKDGRAENQQPAGNLDAVGLAPKSGPFVVVSKNREIESDYTGVQIFLGVVKHLGGDFPGFAL
jgi:hypothetical protein